MAMVEAAVRGSIVNPKGLKITRALGIEPPDNFTGYRSFKAGSFEFSRDEYFAHIVGPGVRHQMPVDAFLRALMRDVAWGFFYGTVNFDGIVGTTNFYGEVELFMGAMNETFRAAGRDVTERFKSDELMSIFKEMISDWTNQGYDPFAAPMETGQPWGVKNGDNDPAVTSKRVTAKRMVGLPGDTALRSDTGGHPVNRMFKDVTQDAPEVYPEPGFEHEVSAFNLFAY